MLELKTEEFADTYMEQMQEDAEVGGADETEFATDCVIDTDLTLMFPADYVPQENERISLYRELDNMESQRDVDSFQERLKDRFGTIPDVGLELIRIVPLRRMARRLGIEKIALKKRQMYAYFVGDENKAYYQSRAFGRMLNYLQQNPLRCKLRENNGKRSMLISDVSTVLQALDILRSITTLEAI